MKSYCLLYNEGINKKKIKQYKENSIKKHNVENILTHHLNDKIVPPYVHRIDETFIPKSSNEFNSSLVLFSGGKKQERLEELLKQDFVPAEDQIKIDKDNMPGSQFKTHKKALNMLTKDYNVIKYGSLAIGASFGADLGITLYGISKFYPMFQEGNPLVTNIMDFFQNFGVSYISSLILSAVLLTSARIGAGGAVYTLFKENNLVTDGKNTFFYRKPTQNKLLTPLLITYYLASSVPHIFAVGWNALAIYLLSHM